MNIAVFASGNGTNFQAIADASRMRTLGGGKVRLLICDQPGAFVIARAKRSGIPCVLVNRAQYQSRQDFEHAIIGELQKADIDLIVLAGFMRMLSPEFVRRYRWRIMNIHPALLPSFKGGCAIKDAYMYGVKVTGVTVHFVDEEMDHGPIILQEPVVIKEKDSLQTLGKRIHRIEHTVYIRAIYLFCRNWLKVRGRRVFIGRAS